MSQQIPVTTSQEYGTTKLHLFQLVDVEAKGGTDRYIVVQLNETSARVAQPDFGSEKRLDAFTINSKKVKPVVAEQLPVHGYP